MPIKLILRILTFTLLPFLGNAQGKNQLDSLHSILEKTPDDTVKLATLHNIIGYYVERDRDSTMYYAETGIAIAKKIKQPLWEAEFLILKAYLHQKNANLVASLKLCNEALAIANDKGHEKNVFIPKEYQPAGISPSSFRMKKILSVYHQLGNIYHIVGDKQKAINYFKKEIQLSYEINDKGSRITSNMDIGSIYLEMSELDSAFIYSNRALENINLWMRYKGFILQNIGEIYFKKGWLDSAQYYFLKSITVNREQHNVAGEIESYNSIAGLFEKRQQPDSMLRYASIGLQLANQLRSASAIANASEQVSKAWRILGNADSALFYLSISKSVSDSLQKDKNDKLLQFQNQNFDDQIMLQKAAQESIIAKNNTRTIALLIGLGLISILAFVFYRNNQQKQKANFVLETTLTNLKSTQSQLIQSEKMASLGELTAGIAHEIQNPLNFVNNFSDVSDELISELIDAVDKGNNEEVKDIAKDIKQNLEKINHHGKRADAIVKGMLQHSRQTSGQKEPTDINGLCDEYVRLSYHGLKAKDKSFNAEIKTDFDNSIGKINVVPQDIGRVVLNLINNAFYAVNEKAKLQASGYEPRVMVETKKLNDTVEIKVSDNGSGIPDSIKEKIFQPFFTTKPTGQGTGLGLSLSYDIVKAHGGGIIVNTKEGEGSEFVIQL